MSMSKKDFIALADVVRSRKASQTFYNENRETMWAQGRRDGIAEMVASLADFCAAQNPRFNRTRWLAYIAGTCGPNGGKR